MDIKGIINKYFKNSKKLMINLIILFLCGVLLILISDISTNVTNKKIKGTKNVVEVNTNTQTPMVTNTYEEITKRELINTLSDIDGVGKISVMIYFEGGSQSIPAMNVNDTNRKTQEKDTTGGQRVTTENTKNASVVIVNEGGESKPFVVRQFNPSIGGVIVVAEGADNAVIKERLFIAVRSVLNLSSNKVSIMPMKKLK